MSLSTNVSTTDSCSQKYDSTKSVIKVKTFLNQEEKRKLIITKYINCIYQMIQNNSNKQNFADLYYLKENHIQLKLNLFNLINLFITKFEIEESTFVYSLYLLHKMNLKYNFLSEKNVKNMILFSMICSIKLHQDVTDYNTFYSKICGLSISAFNRMESEFLNISGFFLFVTEKEFIYFKSKVLGMDDDENDEENISEKN